MTLSSHMDCTRRSRLTPRSSSCASRTTGFRARSTTTSRMTQRSTASPLRPPVAAADDIPSLLAYEGSPPHPVRQELRKVAHLAWNGRCWLVYLNFDLSVLFCPHLNLLIHQPFIDIPRPTHISYRVVSHELISN